MRHAYTLTPEPSSRLRIEHAIAAAILFAVSFRVLAIPFIILAGFEPARHRRAYRAIVTSSLLLTLASPIDLGMPALGRLFGNRTEGVRLLHVEVGMPAHTVLRARHGEYISVGCSGLPCAYQPRWWVVWW
jgi:ABC-type glycerol-3-phosphate transport system permease component